MKTPEERKERRRSAFLAIKEFVGEKIEHLVRPPDQGDVEAALALAGALMEGIFKGFTPKRMAAIKELFEAWQEERSNTP